MNTHDLIRRLRTDGRSLSVSGGRILISPPGDLSDEIRAALRERADVILASRTPNGSYVCIRCGRSGLSSPNICFWCRPESDVPQRPDKRGGGSVTAAPTGAGEVGS